MGDLPPWTCPAIDRLALGVRKHFPEPEKTEALIALESLRAAHVQLRRAAGGKHPEIESAEIQRLNRRIQRLFSRLKKKLEAEES